jgi:outer membrane receptor protein involved in Fe transport
MPSTHGPCIASRSFSKFARCVGVALFLAAIFFCDPSRVMGQIAPTTTATISGSIKSSTGTPVAGARISITGPKRATTTSDAQGYFVFVGVPFGTYVMSATAAKFGTATRQITVTEDIDVAIQYEAPSPLKTIARVSTNAQFNVTPASITHVDPLAYVLNGQTSWRQILEQIPGVSVTGNSDTIFSALPDSPFIPVQISINGALPYETATLLDDMPIISSSFIGDAGTGTNLGLYPLNGFSSADIVRGPGANAPSIVDSIGGSFVLHAPGVVDKDRYDLSISRDAYGGVLGTAAAAVHFGNFSVAVSYGINDSPGPLGVTSGIVPNESVPLTVDGHPFVCSGKCTLTDTFAPGYQPFTGSTGFATGLLICCSSINTYWNQQGGSFALTYTVSRAVTAEIYYAGSTAEIHYLQPAFQVDFTPPSGYTGGFPQGISLLNLGSALYPDSPNRQTSSLVEEKITARLGSGVLRLALLQNRAWNELLDTGLSTQTGQLYGGGAYCNNPPKCTSTTPVVFNGGTYNMTFQPIYVDSENPSNNRDLLLGYATPLGQASHVGVSFVKSYYNTPDYFFVSFGPPSSFTSSTTIPSGVSQTTNETRVFVGGNPSAQTSLDLSWYFVGATYHLQNPNNPSLYSDSTFSYNAPRLGFVWRPTPPVAVRASAGGGFAEAPLGDLIGTNMPFCSGGTCTVSRPNLNLVPEKSFGFDLGTDVRLSRDTMASFDVYRSNLYGQVYMFTQLDGMYNGQPLYATTYGNLGESRYQGMLLDLHHNPPHGFQWALAAGLTRGYVVSVPAGFYNGTNGYPYKACTLCANLEVVPGVNFNGTFAGVVPYSQATGTLGYQWQDRAYVDLVGTYYGNNNSYYRPAFVELDSHFSVPFTPNVSLLLTLRNISGIYGVGVGEYSAANNVGFPSVAGPPFGYQAQYYGPRAVILTAQFHE